MECVFLTGERDVEKKFLRSEEWGRLLECPSPRRPSSFVGLPAFACRMYSAVCKAMSILKELEVGVVVASGGYGCVAPSVAAWWTGLPVFVLEQNALPGRATRLISRWAEKVFCHWEEAAAALPRPERAIAAGTPLRPGLLGGSRTTGLSACGLSRDRRTILIMGGSLGSHALNDLAVGAVRTLGEYKKSMQFVHQTGDADFEWVSRTYQEQSVPACVKPFFDNMADVYRVADLVVSRAGGCAIAELSAFGLPSVLIPYPESAEGHQLINARVQEAAGASIVFEQHDLLPATLAEVWIALVEESSWVGDLARNAFRSAKPDAAMAAAREIEKVLADEL